MEKRMEKLEKLKKIIKMKKSEIDLIQIGFYDDITFEELEKEKAQLKKLEREDEELSNILI